MHYNNTNNNNNSNQSFRRVFDLDSAFNERASPRSKLFSDLYGMFDMNNGLFPQNRLHNFILEPSERDLHPTSHLVTSSSFNTDPRSQTTSTLRYTHQPHSQIRSHSSRLYGANENSPTSKDELITATAIPVVHLPSNNQSDLVSASSTSSLSSNNSYHQRKLNNNSEISANKSNSSSGSSNFTKRDSEAEVDALSNILIKSIGKNYNNNTKDLKDGTKIHMSISGPAALSAQQPQHYSTKRAPTLSSNSRSFSTPSPTNSLSRQSSISTNECHRCRKPFEVLNTNTPTTTPNNNNTNIATKIPEPICGPLNTMFHQNCFTCYRCNASINSDSFFYAQKRLLCSRCVHESLEKCTVCDLVINDRIIRVLGKPYHPKCFICVACQICLDGRPFTVDMHERMFCLDDFHRRYAPRCDGCGQPIKPPEMNVTGSSCGLASGQQNKRIIAGRKTYHLECFGVNDNK